MGDPLKDAEAALAALSSGAAAPAPVVEQPQAPAPEATAAPVPAAATVAPGEIVFSGAIGGPFSIDGKGGFGEQSTVANFVAPGSVLVNGRAVNVTRWKDKSIKGTLPADVTYGPVVVQAPGNKTFNGHFGPKQ